MHRNILLCYELLELAFTKMQDGKIQTDQFGSVVFQLAEVIQNDIDHLVKEIVILQIFEQREETISFVRAVRGRLFANSNGPNYTLVKFDKIIHFNVLDVLEVEDSRIKVVL